MKEIPLDEDPPNTHLCMICKKKFRVHTNAHKSYIITKVRDHFTRHHPAKLKELTKSSAKKTKETVAGLFQQQHDNVAARRAVSLMAAARRAALLFYIYNPQRISKSTLVGPTLASVLDAANKVPTSQWKGCSMSTTTIAKGVAKEYEEWVEFLKLYVAAGRKRSLGNPFAQIIHDCVTLKTGQKYLACGMACVDPWMEEHHTIALGFVPVSSSAAETVSLALDTLCHTVTGFGYKDVAHSTMSDFAALNVAAVFGHVKEGCAMHGDDKIARFAVGDLRRTRMRHVVEPFVEGNALMAKAQRCAVYFSYSTRRSRLVGYGATVDGGVPDIVPKTDISTTRVAARHSMIKSVLLLNKGMRAFASANPDVDWGFSEAEWQALAEMEAVVKVITDVTTIVQTENSQMGAMGHLIHLRLLEQLRCAQLPVLDLANITSGQQPRALVRVDTFSQIGCTCLRRAQLEAERRLCGSVALHLDGVAGLPVLRSDRETMCLLVDPRTHRLHCKRVWTRDERIAGVDKLCNLYVEFFLVADRATAILEVSLSDDNSDILDSEGDDDDAPAALSMDEWEARHRGLLRTRFKKELKAYAATVRDINWKEYANKQGVTDVPANVEEVDPFTHLMNVDVLPLLRSMSTQHPNIVRLATHSRASIASVAAASFSERINSAGGIVSNKTNHCLKAKEIGQLVPLKMNRALFSVLRAKVAALRDAQP